ncbi:MAG: prepilin-type N-terminal cleavage/methylation domain-containing protein [Sedimentisphaerales bacterium]|nr:prepilin-type N-terminal cleavage/methylation domain-containing protein [Sedimentisphaerales bacterium]
MPKQKLQPGTKTRRQGFTLIELLVVIAIISLMASVGGSMFVGTFERLKVDKAASNLFLTAKYARMKAVEQQKRYTLCLDQVNNGFYLLTALADEEGRYREQTIVRDSYCKPITFENNIRFESIQVTPIELETSAEYEDLSTIVFSPDGTAQNAIVQIGDAKTHYTISVNAATGRAKLTQGTSENVTITTVDLDAEL